MLLFSSDAITLDLGAELLELKVQRWMSPLQSCLKDLEAKVEKTRQSQEEVRETLRKAEQLEAKLQQFMVDTCQTQAKLSADLSQVLKQQRHLQNKQDQLVRKQDLLHTTVTGDYFPPIPEAIMTSPVSSVPPSPFSPTGRFFNPPRTRLPLFRSPSCPPSLVLNTPTATTPTDDDISEYLSYLSEELADVLEHPSCPTVKPSGGIPDIDELLQSVSTLTHTHQDGGPSPSVGAPTFAIATHQDGGPGLSAGTQDGGPGLSVGTQDGGPIPSIGTATLSMATHQDGGPGPSIGTATWPLHWHCYSLNGRSSGWWTWPLHWHCYSLNSHSSGWSTYPLHWHCYSLNGHSSGWWTWPLRHCYSLNSHSSGWWTWPLPYGGPC